MKTNISAATPVKTNLTVQTYEVLNSMTRDEVRNLAAHLGVKRGKDKKNTVANLAAAIRAGKARIKMFATISAAPDEGQTYGKTLFIKKFRSYKADKVIQPVPPIVVS